MFTPNRVQYTVAKRQLVMFKSRIPFFIAQFFVFLLAITLPFSVTTGRVRAAVDCGNKGIVGTTGLNGTQYTEGIDTSATVTFTTNNTLAPGSYKLVAKNEELGYAFVEIQGESGAVSPSSSMSFTITDNGKGAFRVTPLPASIGGMGGANKAVYVYKDGAEFCYLSSYTIVKAKPQCSSPLQVSQVRNGKTCFYNGGAGCIQKGIPVSLVAGGLKPGSMGINLQKLFVTIKSGILSDYGETFSISDASVSVPYTFSTGDKYEIRFYDISISYPYEGACNTDILIAEFCPAETCNQTSSTSTGTYKRFELCNQIMDGAMKQQCLNCMTGSTSSSKEPGVWTAIGCIGRDPESITESLIRLGIGMGGGLCLITCLAGGFLLTTSEGNPKKVEEAKDMITGAIIGLLFVLFSVIILQFIGVTIFHIPGFGEPPKTK